VTRRIERAMALLRRGDLSVTEVVPKPTEQPYGVRDCAVRDPAGNLIRIPELR
jgi:catechol 2,3-dioxygenase-like lactoylglutathione lyase family enzyme